jgi:hypothetical protein
VPIARGHNDLRPNDTVHVHISGQRRWSDRGQRGGRATAERFVP